MPELTASSHKKLEGVHPALVRVVLAAVERVRLPSGIEGVAVTEGVRSIARQKELYAKGRTTPGPKVTDTLNSRHLRGVDGWGKAVDLAPVLAGGAIAWTNLEAFNAIANAMLAAASENQVPIRWGADWDRDGKFREKGEWDSPHFELLRSVYP